MNERLHPPPRLFTGCCLLFWGAMTGRPLIGLSCALLIEARYWLPWRWDFDDHGCARAWQLSTLLAAMAAVLLMLEGTRYTALPDLLAWAPALMLPVQFVQSYGMRPGIPLNAISYFARRNRRRALRLGLSLDARVFHFGNVMFFLCLVAASVGKQAESRMFLPGVLLLCGWRVLSMRLCRWYALLPVLLAVGTGGLLGEHGLRYLEERLGRGGGGRAAHFDPTFAHTMIGTTGEVVLSPDIKWRLKPVKGFVPSLIRNASFSVFVGNSWQAPRPPSRDFNDLESRVVDGQAVYLTRQQNYETPATDRLPGYEQTIALPAFLLRGAVEDGDPLPLPGDVAGISGFELDEIAVNSLGTFRLSPKDPVMNGTVYWKGSSNPELPPMPAEDLRIPRPDRDSFAPIANEIGLSSTDDIAVTLTKLRTWFFKEFEYSRKLTIRHRDSQGTNDSAIIRFLTTTRSGHCEYFATAAAMLLREVGIPTRYATGFAVSERDPKRGEFIVRGTHGHAWVRVWNGTQWIDFDPTPPSWLAMAPPTRTWTQQMNDAIKRAREDFFVWRTRPGNEKIMAFITGAIAFLLGSVVVIRLWRSKSVVPRPTPGKAPHPATGLRTPLHDLESTVKQLTGPRPVGEPYAAWVARAAHGHVENDRLSEALTLHQQLRFDPEMAQPDSLRRLHSLVSELRSALGKR